MKIIFLLCGVVLVSLMITTISASFPMSYILSDPEVIASYHAAPIDKKAQFINDIFTLDDNLLLADSEFFSLVKRFVSQVYHRKCNQNPKFCNIVMDKVLEDEEEITGELSDQTFGISNAFHFFQNIIRGCKRNPERCINTARNVIGLSDEMALTFGDALFQQ